MAGYRCGICNQRWPRDEVYEVDDLSGRQWVCHSCVEHGEAWVCKYGGCHLRAFTGWADWTEHMEYEHDEIVSKGGAK